MGERHKMTILSQKPEAQSVGHARIRSPGLAVLHADPHVTADDSSCELLEQARVVHMHHDHPHCGSFAHNVRVQHPRQRNISDTHARATNARHNPRRWLYGAN
eukprot:CAMPEP_0117507498 /NCGR_PEP_ID=MMETSP0784-20121206/26452_1 /TAXON_ID=39447 /ORGANISM="" /LENGTH=102 /DNA_ID=CAMNT_0005302999 /DNA_START=565 /DNA_END=870 /DNA_ORIENTATION=+